MIVKICLLNILFFAYIQCLVLIPERANVTYISDKYLYYARLYITRTSRRSPYYVNVEGKSKHTWTNNVTLNIISFEYLHNEFRRSFPEIHMRCCDILDTDPYIGAMFKKNGIACPIKAGEYHLLNMTVPLQNFPYMTPFYKFRLEMDFTQTYTKEIIGKSYIQGIFKS